MPNETDRTNDPHSKLEADPISSSVTTSPGCDTCLMGVVIDGTEIRACTDCNATWCGHDSDRGAARFVGDALAALSEVRDLLWPIDAPHRGWLPDTIDEIARRLEFLRVGPIQSMAEAIRYCGAVVIELTYEDSDSCYDGKVRVDGDTYSVTVSAPASGYGPGIAYDSPEAYDRVAHAALSFAAADVEWSAGLDIFTPAAESDARGWVIRRHPRGRR